MLFLPDIISEFRQIHANRKYYKNRSENKVTKKRKRDEVGRDNNERCGRETFRRDDSQVRCSVVFVCVGLAVNSYLHHMLLCRTTSSDLADARPSVVMTLRYAAVLSLFVSV